MFLHYYIDTRPHHKHAVHHTGCTVIPSLEHRQYLGMFETPAKAVAIARVVFDSASLCKQCSKIQIKKEVRVRF